MYNPRNLTIRRQVSQVYKNRFREPRAVRNGEKQLTLIVALHRPYPRSTVGNGVAQLVVDAFEFTAAAVAAVASATAPMRAETRTISTVLIKMALQNGDLEMRAAGSRKVYSTSLYYGLVASPKALVVPSLFPA